MTTLDLVLSLILVLSAAGFLVWHLALRRAPPACSPKAAAPGAGAAGANVHLDDKLARALAKAQAKRP